MTDASFSKKLLLPLHKMLRPFELLLVLTGVITLFVAAIQYIAVARQIQLIVSIDDKIVYPNENTRDFSLPLSFDNKSANEVWTAEIEILNAGSDFIGEQDSLWRLFVSADNSQFIEAIKDDPDVVPSSMVHTKIMKLKPNTVAVDLGVFESKSCITLNVMIVNPEEGHSPHFDVSLSLPGVGKPNPGASLWGQFAGRFLPIFASSGFVAVTFLCIRSFRELKSTRQNGIGLWAMALAAFTSYIIGCIFLVLFVSMFFGGVAAAIFLTPSWYESAVARFG